VTSEHERTKKKGWLRDAALGLLVLASLGVLSRGASTSSEPASMKARDEAIRWRWRLRILGILELLIIGGSIAASTLVDESIVRAPLAAGAAATGIVFFVGVLALGSQVEFNIASMRHAIAAAFTSTFIFLVGINVFFDVGQPTDATQLSESGQQIFDAFITLMKVIIAFYFVAEGAVQGITRYSEAKVKEAQAEARDTTKDRDASSSAAR
jgi:hypothetical protein